MRSLPATTPMTLCTGTSASSCSTASRTRLSSRPRRFSAPSSSKVAFADDSGRLGMPTRPRACEAGSRSASRVDAPARRRRIAVAVVDRAALDPARRPPRTVRKHLALAPAIVLEVGVEQRADAPGGFRVGDLLAAIEHSVATERDRAVEGRRRAGRAAG